MRCIYVAANQTSTPGVDFLMGTKQDTSEYRPELDFFLKKYVSVHRPAAASSEDQVPFKPAAGQCRTSGMCTWSYKKCLNNRRREGGSPGFSFCTLHREVIGLSQADSGTWFCKFHTKEQIMDTGRDGEEDWESGIFS